MKRKWKVILSIMALLFSGLSAALGFGFMEGGLPFPVKFACGFVFFMSPVCVVQLVIQLNKKDAEA